LPTRPQFPNAWSRFIAAICQLPAAIRFPPAQTKRRPAGRLVSLKPQLLYYQL
jgi:hypothetical protein